MSHFCVLVIGEEPEEQLAKYDENLELEMHLVATKEECIRRKRQWIEDYKNGWVYQSFLKDPEKYKEMHDDSPEHIKYIEETFPKMLEWTDEQCYEDYIREYRNYIKNGDDWCEIHEDGSLWKNTNDGNDKWDWYCMGGRYRGRLKLRKPDPDAPLYTGWQYGEDKDYEKLKAEGYCDQAYAKDVSNLDEFIPFAIVKDGEWYERGEMGWWCCVSNEKAEEDWDAEVKELLKELPGDTLLTVVDCHI
jgi:hypothetical protein